MDQIDKARLSQLTQKIGVMKGMQMSDEEIEKSFDKSDLDLIEKAVVENDIEKGGSRAVLGEIRNFGGRDMIKTTEGWKYHGKGTGAKAEAITEGKSEKRVEDNPKKDSVNNSLDNQISNIKQKHADAIVKLNNNLEKNLAYLEKVNQIMPKFENCIKKAGFELSSVNARKTGMGSDWQDEDYMAVSVSLKPISGKIKFIEEDGYLKSGDGRNNKKLEAKASSLAEKIFDETGIRCQVNKYSFEVKRGQSTDNKKILVDFWVH